MAIEFKEELDRFRAGQVGFGHDFDLVGSRKVETAVGAGYYVRPSGEGLCDVPSTAAHVTEGKGGITTYMPDRTANANGFEWQADDYVQYLRNGYIVVVTEDATTDGGDVYVRFTDGTGTVEGAFRSNDDTASAAQLPGAYFVGDADAGLAKISFKK